MSSALLGKKVGLEPLGNELFRVYFRDFLLGYLDNNGCKLSMSRKGNCWDNAPMESFFFRLKVELVYRLNFQSISEAKSSLFEYIEVFYNRKRKHSSIGYKSPTSYENEMLKKCS